MELSNRQLIILTVFMAGMIAGVSHLTRLPTTITVRSVSAAARVTVIEGTQEARKAVPSEEDFTTRYVELGTKVEEPSGLPPFVIFDATPWNKPPGDSHCEWEALQFYGRARSLPRILHPNEDRSPMIDISGCGLTEEHSWAELLTTRLDMIVHQPNTYPPEQPGDETRATISLQMLEFYGHYGAAIETYQFRTQVLPQFYRSPELQDRAFRWAMPHIRTVWNGLPTSQRERYLDILRHGESYLATFNLDAENAYLRSLDSGHCSEHARGTWLPSFYQELDRPPFRNGPCSSDFIRLNPNGTPNPYRRLEAWFYRRARVGVSVPMMRHAVQRVITSLTVPEVF